MTAPIEPVGERPESRSERAVVREVLPNGRFLVELDDGCTVAVHPSGAMRVKLVRAVPGDEVVVELSPYDPTKGRMIAPSVRSGPNCESPARSPVSPKFRRSQS